MNVRETHQIAVNFVNCEILLDSIATVYGIFGKTYLAYLYA